MKNENRSMVPGTGSKRPGATMESDRQRITLSLLESAIIAGDFGDPGVAWV